MKNILIILSSIFVLLSCSSTIKPVKQTGIKSIKRATVQEIFPGVEHGDITYQLKFEFDLDKGVEILTVNYNGKSAKLESFKNDSSFMGSVGFSQSEINNIKDLKFNKTKAVITFRTSRGTEATRIINDLTILESIYMP